MKIKIKMTTGSKGTGTIGAGHRCIDAQQGEDA